MLCISIGNCTFQRLLKNLRLASKSADLVEIRSDSIRNFSLPLLLGRKTARPLIFTCLRQAQRGRQACDSKLNGGAFKGGESQRIKLLSSAIISGRFEYVTIDVPVSLKISDSVKTLINLARQNNVKTIIAYHNYRNTPDNIERIYRKLSALRPDAVKMVTYARQFSDNFRIFRLAQTVADRRLAPKCHGALMAPPKLIAFCMGEKGIISRLLYRKFGLFLAYASLKENAETAEGQIPFEQMKYLYRSDKITSRTRIFGLLGNPIEHSYSPLLFNALFKMGGINAVYLPFAVEPGHFKRDFLMLESFLRPDGFSVTSPYKISAMPCPDDPKGTAHSEHRDWSGASQQGAHRVQLVDRLSKAAKEIGAINTIYRKGNKFIGTNTDWIGVIETLFLLRKKLNHRQALILGKGGAARAVVYALRNAGIKTTAFARKAGKDALPLSQLSRYCRGPGSGKIIINATPVGMFPAADKSPVPKTCLKKGMIVFDTIYNPTETRLLKDARSKGCIAVNGLRMFLTQALRQMEYFIGRF